MKATATLALLAAAALAAGCATLSYDGMPAKDQPHAMAVERDGISFVSVDGRPVSRPAFSNPKLRLAPGHHQILTRYDESHTDTDYIGDLEIDVTVHYWSRYAQAVAFDAHEGNRYEISAEAHLPSTEVSYEMWRAELPPDYDSVKKGEISIDIDHELVHPDDWRPIIARILPIKKYWRTHALPVATIESQAPPPAPTEGQAE
jgi:hypothetical protein